MTFLKAGARIALSATILATLLNDASASGTATRSPVTAIGGDQTQSVADGSVIDFNAQRASVTSATTGLETVTSIKVDTTNGSIRGYAAYDLGQDVVYQTLNDVEGSSATGILSVDTTLVSSSGASTSNPVNVTIEMDIHGEFITNAGSPTLLLNGGLVATAFDSALPLNGSIYQSNLSFISSVVSANPSVDTVFESVVSPLGGGGSQNYTGGSVTITSSDPGNLLAKLRLRFPVQIGDSLALSAIVAGIVGAEPDPLNDSDVVNDISVLASAGIVDFSNTANFRIILPEGYSLTGSDPLLNNIVFYTPVPLPSALLFMVSGGLFLIGIQNNKRSLRRVKSV